MTEKDQEQTAVEERAEEGEVVEQAELELEAGSELDAQADQVKVLEGKLEEEAAPIEAEPVDELTVLREQLAEIQAQVEEYLDGWQRARAEFANYRRREEQRRQQMEGEIKARVLARLLPVVDDLDRAFQAVPEEVCDTPWVEGLSLVGHKLQATLEKEGVSPMCVQPGDTFDPNYHEAVLHEPSKEYDEGQIVDVLQRGYKLEDMVLRPALVRVSSGKLDEHGKEGESEPGLPA